MKNVDLKAKLNTKINTKQMVVMSMFAALAYVMALVTRIDVSFLTYEMKDAVICLAAIILGAPYGIVISLLVSAIEAFTISTTGFWGFVMSFIASSVFSFTCAFIYDKLRSFNGAIISVYTAAAALTAVMIPLNLIFTPIYTGAPVSVVVDMIVPMLLPFNLAKALINGALVLMFYKPIITALRRARLIVCDSKKCVIETDAGSKVVYDTDSFKFSSATCVTVVIGLVTIIVGVVVFLWLSGKI